MEKKKIETTTVHYYSERLKQKLNKIKTFPAVIIEAPSGYGKTTALRDYMDANLPAGSAVYWFTAVDEAYESGFIRLCHEIIKIDINAGMRLLHNGFPNAVTIGEACEALRSIKYNGSAWLVIDNFHYLNAGLPSPFLTALLEHGDAGLHIVILTQMLGRDARRSIDGREFLHITAPDLRLKAVDIQRYYHLAGVSIEYEKAKDVERYTEGWIIAVYLQLRAFQETGAFSDTAVITLMENLVWDGLKEKQKTFLLRLSDFETITIQQACILSEFDRMPEYALEALEIPFIRYERTGLHYEFHSILSELLINKRKELGSAFEHECLVRAGNLCRDNNRNAEALVLYRQIKYYEGILSLDLAKLIYEETGDMPFSAVVMDVVQNCPSAIKKAYPISMLRMAWALKSSGMDKEFAKLLEELELIIDRKGFMRAEWILLSSYLYYPHIKNMMPLLKEAEILFEGRNSQVILPDAPWCFGDHSQMAVFHRRTGEADREADELEEFIQLYTKLTGGHGSGADVLFRAELAHYRGDLNNAEVLAYKAIFLAEESRQSIVQLGATMHLCEIAVERSDFNGWQRALDTMEHAATFQNNSIVRTVVDILRGILLNELEHQDKIAAWLKGAGQIRGLSPAIKNNALFVYLCYLMHNGECAKMLGAAKALKKSPYLESPFSNALLSILIAIGHIQMGDKNSAAQNLGQAMENAMPDGFVYLFAAHHWLLQGLSEELMGKAFSEYMAQYLKIKKRFIKGFTQLHDSLLPNSLPGDLTEREKEIALLAAKGLRNSEIADRLIISENTVRTHLYSAFQKLEIDRRSKLAEKLF